MAGFTIEPNHSVIHGGDSCSICTHMAKKKNKKKPSSPAGVEQYLRTLHPPPPGPSCGKLPEEGEEAPFANRQSGKAAVSPVASPPFHAVFYTTASALSGVVGVCVCVGEGRGGTCLFTAAWQTNNEARIIHHKKIKPSGCVFIRFFFFPFSFWHVGSIN